MSTNLFDYFEYLGVQKSHSPWAARAPREPCERFDVKLMPRVPGWKSDEQSLDALGRIEAEPWVQSVRPMDRGVELCLDDGWIEATGTALEAGGNSGCLSELVGGKCFSVQFWDANATKALHVGHLRNLAVGNAIASALEQAGGLVERRSLISDAGRSMGEAMAGVRASNRYETYTPNGQKSDHFVGLCYADYVASAGGPAGRPEDSLTRELEVHNDAADELLKRVLAGESEAVELWFRTRAWVIAGQRKTLAHLGIAFDRVLFESDFLAEAQELIDRGLTEGSLKRREDGVVVYPTGLEDLEEMPLLRADGIPTQHMRALVYWMVAPYLDDFTSMQVCGSEWVSHVTCRRKLMGELAVRANDGVATPIHPTRDIFHGLVIDEGGSVSSSVGGVLLVNDLVGWVKERVESDRSMLEIYRAHPRPEGVAGQVLLGYFLGFPASPRLGFDREKLLCEGESLGWDLVRARSREGLPGAVCDGSLVRDPDYRFAVVQSELYQRHLRQAVGRFDVLGLALYLRHLARWYLERPRSGHIERVVHTLLDRSAEGLGLGGAR